MPPSRRQRTQVAVRVGALVFVLAWLLSPTLQTAIPFWLPFAVLAATELEFIVRGLMESRSPRPAGRTQGVRERRLPGPADADLGWIETVDEEGMPMLEPAPPAARRRSRRLPFAIGVVLAAALFVLALRVDERDTWSSLDDAAQAAAESRFTREGGRIAGRAVDIRCDEDYIFTGIGSDAAGVAFIPQRIAYLAPGVCRTLADLEAGSPASGREDVAFAITVLAHEAVHLRGVRDEALTECYALQEGVQLGQRLGLPESDARELMRSQLARVVSDRSIQRLEYRIPAECRDGGRLDLRPADESFP